MISKYTLIHIECNLYFMTPFSYNLKTRPHRLNKPITHITRFCAKRIIVPSDCRCCRCGSRFCYLICALSACIRALYVHHINTVFAINLRACVFKERQSKSKREQLRNASYSIRNTKHHELPNMSLDTLDVQLCLETALAHYILPLMQQ